MYLLQLLLLWIDLLVIINKIYNMKLSIILPTYNMEQYLPRCLESLLAQDIPKNDYEIIIVNDESKDNTLKIAQEYAKKNENIVVCDKKNGGAGAARNAGLKIAKGKYIHFVDPDDYVAENVYKTLIDFADNSQLDILTFIFLKTTSTVLSQPKSIPNTINIEKIPILNGIKYIAENNYRNTVWWYLINKDFLDETGLKFIEGRWMEDSILTPQLFMKATRMAKMPLDVYRYMITPNSAMTSKEPEHYNKLISDIENATFVFDDILNGISSQGNDNRGCKK